MRTVPDMEKVDEKRSRLTLTLLVSGIIFSVIIAFIGIAFLLFYLPYRLGVFNEDSSYSRSVIIIILATLSLCLGAFVTYFITKIPLRPVNNVINSFNKLASGDFSTRIKLSRTMMRYPSIAEFSESFNAMAEELESTEMLRSDFINNFSHEFKTPIVSIAGFAKLLRKGNLTEEQKEEYLQIIEEESLRLSYMATNVLNLTKLENQTILSNVAKYNLSEQIRNCVLLLENKWSAKNLDMDIDFNEYYIEGNSEILKEVWINLIDNAIKYTEDSGVIKITVRRKEGKIIVAITNTSATIPQEKLDKIFNKFYQTEESHSQMGNGVGLAIVKKAVELHSGSVSVESADDKTTFTVTLPEKRPVKH